MKRPSLALACLALSATSCAPILVGAGAAYIVNEEYLASGIHETRLEVDVEDVWAGAREAMAILSTAGAPEVTEEPRRIVGTYRQRTITVHVQALDLDLSLLQVQAKRLVGYDEEVARDVTDYIVRQLSPGGEAEASSSGY